MKKITSAKIGKHQIRDLKVLIAEDDEISALLLSSEFEIFSNDIFTVGTGVDALDTCRNNPAINLIMMDVRMPEMNGYEATRQIRQFNKDVIIIANTAYGDGGEMEKERATSVGCNEYISKPINFDLLTGLIHKYFQ